MTVHRKTKAIDLYQRRWPSSGASEHPPLSERRRAECQRAWGDNNQNERDLHKVRLQIKISRPLRSQRNAKAFTGRSYVETGRKQGANPIEILVQLFQDDPWKVPRALP